MPTIETVLQKVHRKFAKDTDYPEAASEDRLVRLDHADDGISVYEGMVEEGIYPSELYVGDGTIACGGTGTDPLPTDFLSIIRAEDQPAIIKSGNNIWIEVSAHDFIRYAQEGYSSYVFTIEGSNLRTLPAASGTIPFPYMKKHTRYETGDEATELEMKDSKFLEHYILAKVFLDNGDDTLYQSNMLEAKERLSGMKYDAIANPPKYTLL